ncbi:bifunctional diaminohydroxyphosphoribosylaminopyrimidine deaminase/5-amino-6-(5-phosphoribosylamino)uracil reductase RibD [Fulvivirga sp. M361]|uniref:bifunctional diaminohydroxyphosphoribosylaminopyrimidine deaminase/5-amino-6-(5-phosphoribosylamino)uracil reductase RibD n=1 Tax=Fulvivirga sp. M361 TaxID=2594266 RepID=UPI00117B0CDF|nr:bifunctional diaminohydroxyphosphoribosylaminopyrimidine deaminase/5-amino-6-(5-phosphoribosylamino)uracil reductase RibD [Fulvivirga sp. M361]TRX50952.1 bifunctional diaminohydroxyphosphoribosylaminopyrimidine deaminase/5-amino-6-(5-phosphoribosylamino)uracil reductase RibD [Fulvivirga sp. M361]
MNEHELYMLRAIEIAQYGKGNVSPNPMVGCVIVYNNKIIGEGWHRKYGEGHAEVNAINSVQDKRLLPESTVYVTLEPCAHYGKTPPCADLLIEHSVKKVFIAVPDPNPLVLEKGIGKLKKAGIAVETGLLKELASEMNKRFLFSMTKKRPYVILKWAETNDGFLARENHDSKWISNQYSRMLVHTWRAEEDAILVGTNTALYDDPRLNVREVSGKNPVRIVIDRHLRLSTDLNLFDGSERTICYNLKEDKVDGQNEWVQLTSDHFEKSLLEDLYTKGIRSIIIEGGKKTLDLFIQESLWNEARVFISQQTFGCGIKAPVLKAFCREENIHGDRLIYYKNS